MTRVTIIRLPILLLTALILGLAPAPAYALTEQEWMVALVEAIGRSFGLPDIPAPKDYINILSGKRNLHFEAEDTASPDDSVSRMALPNFGTFSGSGWLLGISRPTDVHLSFVVPLDGLYHLAAALRSPGHVVKVAGQTFQADGAGDKFTTVELGDVSLAAGPATVVITLPPGGALDFITLTAPDLPPITPAQGWQAEAPLTWEILATTTVQALNLGGQLPVVADGQQAFEAESLEDIGAARLVEDSHLGAPSAGRWLRTSVQPATLQLPLNLPAAGFFDLTMTATGGPIKVRFNQHLELAATAKAFLEEISLPPVYLPKGDNRLAITLPQRSGLDRIVIKPRQSDLAALTTVLQQPLPTTEPTPADLDRLYSRLANAPR